MILLTTVALLAGVIGAGGFNLHLALEVMNNYEATNTGDYLRTNTLKQSVIPAINMIGKALIAMEGRDMVQKNVAESFDSFVSSASSICYVCCGRGAECFERMDGHNCY